MKQCAAQSDRIARVHGLVAGKRDGDITILGWQNHYSPAFERCYLEVSYMNHAAKKRRDIPLLYYELFDAFEGKLLATCTDANFKENVFCDVADRPGSDCSGCRQFIADRMRR